MYKLFKLESTRGTICFCASKNIEEELLLYKTIEDKLYKLIKIEKVSAFVYEFYNLRLNYESGLVNIIHTNLKEV